MRIFVGGDEPAKLPADPDAAAAQDVQRLKQQLTAMRTSWTWRLGRMLTKPFDLFVRRRAGVQQRTDASDT